MCAEKQAEQANSAVCKGLAIAATAEVWQFCNAEQDCTTWNQVKKVVITIYEAELGDFIADGLGLVGAWMCILLLWGPCKAEKRFSKSLIIPCVATFIVDLWLELVVYINVQGALASIETVKEAFCMSQGANDSMVLLLDQAEEIGSFAFANMVMAGLGGLVELLNWLDLPSQYCQCCSTEGAEKSDQEEAANPDTQPQSEQEEAANPAKKTGKKQNCIAELLPMIFAAVLTTGLKRSEPAQGGNTAGKSSRVKQ